MWRSSESHASDKTPPSFGVASVVSAYHEWGRRGPPTWMLWALVLGLVGIIVGLLVTS